MSLSNMMNRPEAGFGCGESMTTTIYCSRCGKPKYYTGDYGHWETDCSPWCTCQPIDKFVSGQFKSQGWECPNCNRVYAPGIDECLNCRPVDTEPILA